MAAPLRVACWGRFVASRLIFAEPLGHRCHPFNNVWCLSTASSQKFPLQEHTRHSSFFAHSVPAEELWKGVIAVSNAGRKRGRGKRVGRKKVTDLNRGQILGLGKANIQWPGLNAPILKGREVVQRKQLPPNPDHDAELIRIRDEMSRIRYPSLPPLLRGWSGKRFPGQSVGPPDPIADYTFDGFDTKVLEFKLVTNMTGTLGRKMRFTAFVVTGNKNGLAGYGLGKSQNGRTCIRVAKNRAAQNLQYIERFDNHTVFHNMHSQYKRSKVFINKKEKGYGIRGHRVIKTISQLIGFKDLEAKVEGSTKNIKCVCKAFFQALRNQETHQALADRTGLHVVEFRKERDNFPTVVASPSSRQVEKEELIDEEEDIESSFERLYYGGRVEYIKPPKKRPYHNTESWRIKQQNVHRVRNQYDAHIGRLAGVQ